MAKVRFACPRCQTIMQTGSEKVGYDVACPHCAHRFRLVDSDATDSSTRNATQTVSDERTLPPTTLPNSDQLELGELDGPAASSSRTLGLANSNKPGPNSERVVSHYPVTNPQPGFRCPYCQSTRPPSWKSEVSQIGWIVFAILLVTTCVCCWVGLFIRDKYRVCSQCNIRLD